VLIVDIAVASSGANMDMASGYPGGPLWVLVWQCDFDQVVVISVVVRDSYDFAPRALDNRLLIDV
jgi:hypothetical protein